MRLPRSNPRGQEQRGTPPELGPALALPRLERQLQGLLGSGSRPFWHSGAHGVTQRPGDLVHRHQRFF